MIERAANDAMCHSRHSERAPITSGLPLHSGHRKTPSRACEAHVANRAPAPVHSDGSSALDRMSA